MKEQKKLYYNYVSYYRGIVVYVGKGTKDRWTHTVTGQSGSELINDFYFRNKYFGDMLLETHIVKRFATSEQALKGENSLIKKYLPYCNKCSGRDYSSDEGILSKIKNVCELLGYDPPEDIESKFDFKFLFTPKGLLCPYISLGKNSPFEKREGSYHIHIKKDFYQHFPEYALQFMKVSCEMSSHRLAFFSAKFILRREFECGMSNGVNYINPSIEWALSCYQSESFNYSEGDFVNDYAFDIDRFNYNYYICEQHVTDYQQHVKLEERKERNRATAREKALRKKEQIIKSPTYVEIKVLLTELVAEKLISEGFNVRKGNKWFNLSWRTKSYCSTFSMSAFTAVGEEVFLGLDLSMYKK